MKILAMDTAAAACSVAMLDGNQVLAHRFEKRARGQAEVLLPMAEAVVAEAGLDYAAMDAIATTVGPGTFTGLRIGLATARAIALAAHKPIIGVTSLEALAHQGQLEAAPGQRVIAALDARRGQIYSQAFEDGQEVAPALARNPEELPEILREGALVVGDAQKLIEPEAKSAGVAVAFLEALPDARYVAAYGAAIAAKAGLPPLGQSPEPVYLRHPDAKLPGGIEPAW